MIERAFEYIRIALNPIACGRERARLRASVEKKDRRLEDLKGKVRALRSSNAKLQAHIELVRELYPPDPENRCLNFGAGNWYYPKWENIDLYADEFYTDYKVDLRLQKPSELPDGCARLVFCSHLLEHLPDEACVSCLREFHRLLKPEGVCRISVPDMDKALEAYRDNNAVFFDEGGGRFIGDSIEAKLVNFFASYSKDDYRGGPIVPSDLVRQKLQSLGKYEFVKWCVSLIPSDVPYRAHVNGYDFDKLRSFLEIAGFSQVVRSSYRNSSIPLLREKAFDNRPIISLFVEAFRGQ